MSHFDKVKEALEFIDEHLDEQITLEIVAKHFNFSAYYFHRLFSVIVGKTMAVYVNERRMQRACIQLSSTDQRIIDIGFGCGFNSAQAFSRAFKLFNGLSPKEYRSQGFSPIVVTAEELIMRFTNRLKGGIYLNPKIIKCDELIIAGVSGDEVIKLPASKFASFEIYVTNGYESENNAMNEWLETNQEGYTEKLLDNTHYCVEYYDERFNGSESGSIVEIWIPIEKSK